MKKLLTFALAVVLLFSFCSSALAADIVTASGGSASKDVTASYTTTTSGTNIFNVDISWGSLAFTYTETKVWDAGSLSYVVAENTVGTWSCETDANAITVTNRSNVAVIADLTYNKAVGSSVEGTFSASRLELDAPTTTATTGTSYLTLSGKIAETSEPVTVGNVTVAISSGSQASTPDTGIDTPTAGPDDSPADGPSYDDSTAEPVGLLTLIQSNTPLLSHSVFQTDTNLYQATFAYSNNVEVQISITLDSTVYYLSNQTLSTTKADNFTIQPSVEYTVTIDLSNMSYTISPAT